MLGARLRGTIQAGVLLLLTASPALASEEREAQRVFARASVLFQQRDYEAALTAFRRAYELRPHHAVLCSMARCHEYLGRPVEATAHYERCLKEGGHATPLAARIERARDELRRLVAYVHVTSGQAGRIHVDGRPVGRPPLRVALNPGKHLVELRRDARRLASSEVVLAPGEERRLAFTVAAPSARVALTPAPAADPTTQPTRTARRRLRSGWFWGTLATTLALGGATAAFGALTLSKQKDYDANQTPENADRFYRYRTFTNVFVGLTAAAASSTCVLFFFTDFGAKRGEVAGLGLHARF
jgi:tetratricopeptide (TPR) repeat protein